MALLTIAGRGHTGRCIVIAHATWLLVVFLGIAIATFTLVVCTDRDWGRR